MIKISFIYFFLFSCGYEKIFKYIHGFYSISIGQLCSTLLYYVIRSLPLVAKPFTANGCIFMTISNVNDLSAWMMQWRMWKGTKEEKQRCHLKLSAVKSQSSKTWWLLSSAHMALWCYSLCRMSSFLCLGWNLWWADTSNQWTSSLLPSRQQRKTPLLMSYLGAHQQNTLAAHQRLP